MKAESDRIYCLLGVRGMLKNLRALKGEIAGVREPENIDPVHDMRVASRRLRTGFALCGRCFPGKALKMWNKEIRRVTKQLGQARDLDVQKDCLQEVIAGLPSKEKDKRPGIERLMLRLSQRRERAQPELINALDRLEGGGVLKEMERTFRGMRAEAKGEKVTKKPACVYPEARKWITARLEDVLAYEKFVYKPERKIELHQMRIEAKHLRYTMEYFELYFDGELTDFVKRARQLQTLLGELHDCDVWIDFLPRFIEEERLLTIDYFGEEAPFELLKPGLQYLMAEREKRRQEVYGEFVRCWEEIKGEKLWRKLPAMLETHVKSAKG